jgi:hypothetical protein
LTTAGSRRQALLALAAGSLSLGFLRVDDADAKKKHKHKKKRKNKRCLKLGSICKPGGKRHCCSDHSCEVRAGNTQADCCIALGGICETAEDCCAGGCIPSLLGSTVKHCQILTWRWHTAAGRLLPAAPPASPIATRPG